MLLRVRISWSINREFPVYIVVKQTKLSRIYTIIYMCYLRIFRRHDGRCCNTTIWGNCVF
jgi:hypothetical protein